MKQSLTSKERQATAASISIDDRDRFWTHDIPIWFRNNRSRLTKISA
jgi:hypothetical protein